MIGRATDEDRPHETPPSLQFTLRGLLLFSAAVTVCISLATTAVRADSDWVSLGCGVSSVFAAWVVLLITYLRLNARSAWATHILMALLIWLFLATLIYGSGRGAVGGFETLAAIFIPAAAACLLACVFSVPMFVVTMLIAFYHSTRARRGEDRHRYE